MATDHQSVEPKLVFAANTRAKRQRGRIADNLFAAFHQACDQGDLDLAGSILHLLEEVIARRPDGMKAERRGIDELIAGYSRLWMLRHPEALAA